MRTLRTHLLVYFFPVLLGLGCEHAPPLQAVGGGQAATFGSIQDNIFSVRCAISSCHIGSGSPLGLDLSAGKAFANIVGVPSIEVPRLLRIDPTKPDSSYLVMKIEGAAGIQASRMPANGPPFLSPEQIGAIRQWVSDGAPSN
ncbi:MAG: hypothetical protein ACE5EO_06295 [Candidatus Krumholzibacteriia bacterium]